MIVGRFDCGSDGSVYTLVDGYLKSEGSTPNERIALLRIRLNGEVINYAWRSSAQFKNFSLPKSIFVGYGRVYVLITAEPRSLAGESSSALPLVLTFDQDGTLLRTVVLDQDFRPLVLGVFPSDAMLIASEDTLNHRMAIDLVSSTGKSIRRIRLNGGDFVERAANVQSPANVARYSPSLLTAMSKLYPFGDHLLFVPLETSGLPIVELDEAGNQSSFLPRLPGDMLLEGVLGITASGVKLRLSTPIPDSKVALDADGKQLGVATRPSSRIVAVSRKDGSLLGETDLGEQPAQPACVVDDTYTFLTAGTGRGALQVVQAHAR